MSSTVQYKVLKLRLSDDPMVHESELNAAGAAGWKMIYARQSGIHVHAYMMFDSDSNVYFNQGLLAINNIGGL